MVDFDPDRNPLDVLAEDFTRRCRAGECPSVSEYARNYPDLADEIRDLFPSIGLMEQMRRREDSQREVLETQSKVEGQLARIGEYEILREVGRGGMGVVFEARQKSLGRRVALKVLTAGVVSSPKQLIRFRREAAAAARLHHTNIVPVFGIGEQEDVHYYAMQFIDGVTLHEVLEELKRIANGSAALTRSQNGDASGRPSNTYSASTVARALFDGRFTSSKKSVVQTPSGPSSGPETKDQLATADGEAESNGAGSGTRESSVPGDHGILTNSATVPAPRRPKRDARYWKAVARIGVQIAEALEYAHAQGVLHRDIKPANLLLDTYGAAWIADFGLAKLAEQDQLTKTGDIVGTLRYMAPEQFDGQGDKRSDIYSLGLTLYELLTLAPACEESSHTHVLKQVTTPNLRPPRSVDPAIPRDLETIVLKATAVDPDRRYATAGQLADDLQRFLEDLPVLARRTSAVERLWRWGRRNPLTASLTATILLLLMVVAVVTTVSNFRTRLALARAQAEHARAEANLNLALEAFKGVIESVASRGVPQSFQADLEEDSPKFEIVVTAADAELLQNLLKFFDEFAERNQAGLHVETALALRRVGDIRQRLGQFDLAEVAYRQALAKVREFTPHDVQDAQQAVAQAEILNDIGIAQGKRGQIQQALASHQQALVFMTALPVNIALTKTARFELAQTLNLMASVGPRSGLFVGRFGSQRRGSENSQRTWHGPPPTHGAPATPHDASPRDGGSPREPKTDARGRSSSWMHENHEWALELLRGLVDEEPTNSSYRLALARCYRNRRFVAWMSNRPEEAIAFNQQAVQILDELVREFPTAPEFRFELADTLSMTPPPGTTSETALGYRERLERAVQIGQELNDSFPGIPEYRALLANSRVKLATLLRESQELESAEANCRQAMALQTSLVEQFPQPPAYRLALARSQNELARLRRERGQLAESRQMLEAAVAGLEAWTKQSEPNNPFYDRVLGSLYRSLGETLRELGEVSLADESDEKARQLDHHWPRRFNTSPPVTPSRK